MRLQNAHARMHASAFFHAAYTHATALASPPLSPDPCDAGPQEGGVGATSRTAEWVCSQASAAAAGTVCPIALFPPTSAGSPPLVAASFERAQGLRSLITQAPALAFVFHSARALKSTEARALRQACPLRIRQPISERPFQSQLECCIACARPRAHARTAGHARKNKNSTHE